MNIKVIGDGLVLKTAQDEDDVERVAKFDGVVFGDEKIGEFCRSLFLNHPNTQFSDLIFVENERTGEVVSSLCLIPWQWNYGDVKLGVAEMGIVGTLEPYRCRGLIRAQVNYFKELINKREFDISIIQGIPHFYRQFDYEYAIPLERWCQIEFHQIPDIPEMKYTCHQESASDINHLERLYNETANDLDIHTCRTPEIWKYLVEISPLTVTDSERWIVEDTNKNIAGYFSIQKHPFGNSLSVNEVSRLSYDMAMAVLKHLKQIAIERGKPNIRLNLPANDRLVRIAKYHGAHDTGGYAWQIHIPCFSRFLKKIGLVLEQRLRESPFENLTENVLITFYKEKIEMCFSDGKLTDVRSLGFSSDQRAPIRLPWRAAIPLFMGYKSRDELRESWHDMGTEPKQSLLIDHLFPKMDSYIYSIY